VNFQEIPIVSPAFVFGSLVALIFASTYHVLRDGGIGRLIFFLFCGWLGFWAGHLLAEKTNMFFGTIGVVHFGLAIIISVIFLFIGDWLSLSQKSVGKK
jgi:hypothetical protein